MLIVFVTLLLFDGVWALDFFRMETGQRKTQEEEPASPGSGPPPLVAWRKVNQAMRHQKRMEHVEAVALLEEALEAQRAKGEGADPEVARILDLLPVSLEALGEVAKAEEALTEALEIRRKSLGEGHPYTLDSVEELAIFQQSHGKPDEAEALFRKSMEVKAGLLRPTHPDLLGTKQLLIDFLLDRDETGEATRLWGEVIEAVRKARALGDGRRAQDQYEYGLHLLEEKSYTEAEVHLQEAYEGRLKKAGEGHFETRRSLRSLVDLYKAMGKTEKVEEYETLLLGTEEDASER